METDPIVEESGAEPVVGSSNYRPLRIWPPVILLVGMIIFRFVHLFLEDAPAWIWMFSAFGPALCGLFVIGWWVTFSRATWVERIAGFLGVIAAGALSMAFADPTMLGPTIPVVVIPLGTAAFAVASILFGRMLSFQRTSLALLAAVLGFGFTLFLRNEGMWGDFSPQLAWRLVPSVEDQLVANRGNVPEIKIDEVVSDVEATFQNAAWPGFRGPHRDGIQSGTKLNLDWKTNPPKELWRIPVGPGWSSFAVAGDLLFTQEQRGEMETVVCYSAIDGREIWTQELETRFEDALGGPGPRATPELRGGFLYSMGGSGFLTKIDATSGKVIWKQNIFEVAEPQMLPMWGYSCSPSVTKDGSLVIVYGGEGGDKSLLAFDTETGDLRWNAESGEFSYSSPHLLALDGSETLALLTKEGLDLFEPQTGKKLLAYNWPHEGYRALQPHLADDGSILIPTGLGTGTRRIRLSGARDQLDAKETWTTRALKADFSDLVVHEGFIYGFDGGVFTCLDFETGARKWKAGRYGKGQALLLKDSNAIIVITEKGDLVLLKTDPEKHNELAKIKALNDKTWNHPVVVGDRLFIRNSKEAACYKLAVE